ncbi:hypothetical protein, partial [Pseudomonas oryzihabitans]|uniref:hypothetical protein n=1 Tax=Pseudomonas oryzihabitans TaxID=47885 RepID=UPI002B1DC3E5
MLTVHSPVTTAPTDKSFIGCFVIRRRNEVGENTQVTEMYDAVLGNGRSTHTPESFLQELLIDINHKSREDLRRRDSIV